MRFPSKTLITSLGLVAGAAASPLRDRQVDATKCPSYLIVEAPGLGDIKGFWTAPTSYGIMAKLPGGQRYPLKTPPPADDGPNGSGTQLIQQASEGSLEIVRVIAQETVECPETQIVLFGYSYGTIEAVLAMNNPAFVRTNVAAVLMYGNCFWHGGRIEDRGNATSGKSVCGSVEGLGTPPDLEYVTNDFCNIDDYLCTGTPYTWKNNTHWSYKNSKWQDQAVDWAVSRLKADDTIPIPTTVDATGLVPTASEFTQGFTSVTNGVTSISKDVTSITKEVTSLTKGLTSATTLTGETTVTKVLQSLTHTTKQTATTASVPDVTSLVSSDLGGATIVAGA